MKKSLYSKLLFWLKYYLLWVGLSVVARTIFLLVRGDGSLTTGNYFSIFYKGLVMDLSWGGYIMMLISVVMALTPYISRRVVGIILQSLSLILFVFFWFIIISDLELFKHWGYHIDATPLLYIKTPKAALASISYVHIFFLGIVICLLVIGTYLFANKFIMNKLHYTKNIRNWWETILFLLLGGVLIIPVRGGVNLAPLNSSFVYFHKTNMFANQAAINPVWNFLYEVTHMNNIKHDYVFMPQEEAERIVDSLNHTGKEYPLLLKEEKPNIIVLLLESFTADAIEILGGEPGVTPHLNQLAKEGVLFSRVYATGNRSDRGISAVIGGLPAHPNMSLMKYPNKMAEFPSFSKDLERIGYHTKFYYAGDINFGRFRSYVTMNFQDMVTEDNFSGEARKNSFKWGIHDEYMFDYLFEDIKKAPDPFMYMAFTMSSHEPFEVPMETVIEGNTEDKKFLNSIHYTDRCLGDFVAKLKESGKWENTLLVLIADHGTIKIKNREAFDPEAFHIPMIFTGGAVNVQDTVISTLGSQTDMASTLLSQFPGDHSEYPFSKNLLAEDVIPFAYYAYYNTVGMITPQGVSVFNTQSKNFIMGKEFPRNVLWSEAYLQKWDDWIK